MHRKMMGVEAAQMTAETLNGKYRVRQMCGITGAVQMITKMLNGKYCIHQLC